MEDYKITETDMANPWFKFYGGEYLGDPKMDAFDGNERSCWLTVLSLASQSDEGWILYTSEEKLLEKSGIPTAERVIYSGVLAKYQKFEMLEACNGDVTQGFRPKNWEKRQYSEGYSRVKRFREKESNDSVTAKITTEENRIEENRIDKNIYAAEFEKFWSLYPKKVGKPKSHALWKLLSSEDRISIMADLPLRKFDDKWVNGFVKDPERYIKNRQWEDEISKPRQQKSQASNIIRPANDKYSKL